MKISGLDFLSDFEKRLLASMGARRQSDPLEFHRLLNFFEKTMVLKIGWTDLPLGRLTCRMVEEPQDFYFRGMFQSATNEQPYSFTLRPGKDYEKDISQLVDVIAVTAKEAKSDAPVTFDDAFAAAFAETAPNQEQEEPAFSPEAFFAARETSAEPEAFTEPEPAAAPKDTRTPEEILDLDVTITPQKTAASEEPAAPKVAQTTEEILDLEVTITPQKTVAPEDERIVPEEPAAATKSPKEKDTRTPEETIDLEVTITPQKTTPPEEPAEAPAEAPPKAKGKRAAKKE